MTNKPIPTITAALALLLTTPTAAQGDASVTYGARDINAAVGITLPFGGTARRSEPARVELLVGRDHIGADGARLSRQLRAVSGTTRQLQPPQLRLGLSIERQARLTINGRAVQGPQDDRAGVSTLGKVAIGVGVAVGLVLVAGIIALNSIGPTD